jgi:hypothetical protein
MAEYYSGYFVVREVLGKKSLKSRDDAPFQGGDSPFGAGAGGVFVAAAAKQRGD